MRLSCAEQMLGQRPIEDKLDFVREAGLDGIDLRMATVSEASARDRLADSGVPVGAIYSQLREPGLLSAAAEDRAGAVGRVVEYAETADAVGASNLIVVPVFGAARLRGFEPVLPLHYVETAVLMVSLAEIAERIADLSVRVTIEPLNHGETHFLTDPGVGAGICDAIGSPRIATMVDTYHCEREGQDIPEMIKAAGEQLALVHLSDTERRLPGGGDIDFGAVLATLDDCGYTGWLGLECRPVDDVEDLRRSVRHLREGARP
ncbi:Sugar phosphate isomerase/epimerase [Actinopolymorpha cephalotaxi]|uniref:Sugar phosphate isomerase/epimerase n=2 Tax=Actinopolymorpha cephalotaxi TaxID=504797 RepID=A0A1I2WT46_9ACTN|nr:sugar phosphate isomerase/epimerase [Actinopolymorpha cephalotaxi]SFH03789.1 Sugar phosphate isomerase/epimerase [Actinopolymorpha cephalotaxi]